MMTHAMINPYTVPHSGPKLVDGIYTLNGFRHEQSVPEPKADWSFVPPHGKGAGALAYRHNATGETILVPSIWYNQPLEWRIDGMAYVAARTTESARRQAADGKPWSRSLAAQQLRSARRCINLARAMKATGQVLA